MSRFTLRVKFAYENLQQCTVPRRLRCVNMHFVATICILCILFGMLGSASALSLQAKVQPIQQSPHIRQQQKDHVVHQDDYVASSNDLQYRSNTQLLPLWKANALLMVVASIYGLDYSVCKLLQRQFQPEVVSTLKYSLATLYFIPSFIRSSYDARFVRVGVELGLWCTIYAISISHAVQTTPASKVSFFAALGMILAPIYDLISPDKNKKDSPQGTSHKGARSVLRTVLLSPFIAPLLAITGVLLMECETFSNSAFESVSTGTVTQNLRLLVSPLSSSMCYWRASRLSREQQTQQQQQKAHSEGAVPAVMLATVAMLCGSFCIMKYGMPEWIMSVFDADTPRVLLESFQNHNGLRPLFFNNLLDRMKNIFTTHGVTILLVLVSSLLATGWSTVTEQRALRVVSAAQVSVLLSLEPLFASFFAYVLLGENVGANTALAAVFIVAASLWGPLAENLNAYL